MVTTQEIESLGWSLEGTYRNGGSKGFKLNNYHLTSHADNFISKKDEIKITRTDGKSFEVYKNFDQTTIKDGRIDKLL